MVASYERLKEVISYYAKNGEYETLNEFDISPSTLSRYINEWKRYYGTNKKEERLDVKTDDVSVIQTVNEELNKISDGLSNLNILKKIEERYSPEELKLIADGGGLARPEVLPRPKIKFNGDRVRIGYCTDSHMGSYDFIQEWWESMVTEFNNQDVDYIFHCGDIVEGISGRKDQIFNLTHIGYQAQREYAEEMLSMINKPTFIISGNHDRFFNSKLGSGNYICKDLSKILPNVTYLGEDEGIVEINGTKIMMFHGEDGSSYATSYRIQRHVSELQPGTKPNVILYGHTHKSIYVFERNIHCVGGGCISKQSAWMRSKKLAAHSGFWIIDLEIDNTHVVKFTPTWYPLFV